MLVVYIRNDRTAEAPLGNYVYQVKTNARLLASGHVTDHKLEDGWAELVRAVVDHATDGDATKPSASGCRTGTSWRQ